MNDLSLPLFIWLSPSFPVGAFAYSHGLEQAVETGDIADAASLQMWIHDLLHHGSGRNDCVLLVEAWSAARVKDFDRLRAVNELALALAPSAERYLETRSQGNAFVLAIASAWPCPMLDELKRADGDVAYVVALATAASVHQCPLRATLEAALLAFVANLVSAAVRLGPIGQTDGQKIIAACVADVRAIAEQAETSSLADLGGSSLRADLLSMRHETQYSRLFRS